MVQQFEDQGGTASSNPSRFKRWMTSMVLRRLVDPLRREKQHRKIERRRKKRSLPHTVEYFHQVDDPYSHLAVQALQSLAQAYDIELHAHLVPGPRGKNLPEPELLQRYAVYDAALVAPHYGLRFPHPHPVPADASVQMANRILAGVGAVDFARIAQQVGEALWSGDHAMLDKLAGEFGVSDPELAEQCLAGGSTRQAELGHYSGGMFYYGGEWYWGVDRLYHLERRLCSLGAKNIPGEILFPRPAIESADIVDHGSLTLEVYASLRSPYTSIIFDRVVQLAEETGVAMVLRPVFPMVMRGVSLSRQKGVYIFRDAAREAQALGLDWGPFYDPIGDPVVRAYSLYPEAEARGKGVAFFSAFLQAAFFTGVNTNTDAGLKQVLERAGLPWREMLSHPGDASGLDEVERNRLSMYAFGCWGVPTFRLLDGEGNTVIALWGQDRLWLVAREIKRLLEVRQK